MILEWLKLYFIKRRQQAALRDFEEKWGYSLKESSYLTIGSAGIVSDYGYLIRYITEDLPGGAIDTFDDYERIANQSSYIDSRIAMELQSDKPRETRLTSLETALANLRNLRLIIKCLTAYVEMARTVGLPVSPMKSG